MRPVLFFDVNESLLDLKVLEPHFKTHFGDRIVVSEWFDQVIQTAMLSVILGWSRNFAEVGRSALAMVVDRHELSLTEEALVDIVGGMKKLPPHDDVMPGLKLLNAAGFRMVALTNSPVAVAEEQLRYAGLIDFFETVISVEEVKTLKPDAKVYVYATQKMDVEPSNAYLIAAHAWDVAGAMAIGCKGALIKRVGIAANPIAPEPTITAESFTSIANLICIAHEPKLD
ncbi:haloacid dehalogenase type II [Burkholderiales bacterium]|nr:haloacid dehalogenase type II [Burkholderiales bacterium]